MNTTKKLLVLVMVALMAAVSVMPSTFSWYNHNASADGKYLRYSKTDLPVSMQSTASTINMSTVLSDQNNVKTSTAATNVNLAAGGLQYYTTTLTNTGTSNVYVDLNMNNLKNDADFYIGTLSPTVNEKAYASKAVRTKKANTTTRVYFKTHPNYSSFWAVDNGTLTPESSAAAGSNNSTNDINIAYKANGASAETMAMMSKCPTADSGSLGNSSSNVYYYDLPSDAEYFYFFNHWYLKSATSREWNRTYPITDTKTKGVIYYLTGQMVGEELYKECKALAPRADLVGVNSYYDTVRMSLGSSVFADIGLKQDSDEEDFIPEYYGKTISYKVQSGTSYVSVSSTDGIITPKATTGTSNSATVRTTITGKFGDTATIDTTVTIPTNIAQVPIMQNILVPYNGAVDSNNNPLSNKVEIHWYALNKSSTDTMTTASIFITV